MEKPGCPLAVAWLLPQDSSYLPFLSFTLRQYGWEVISSGERPDAAAVLIASATQAFQIGILDQQGYGDIDLVIIGDHGQRLQLGEHFEVDTCVWSQGSCGKTCIAASFSLENIKRPVCAHFHDAEDDLLTHTGTLPPRLQAAIAQAITEEGAWRLGLELQVPPVVQAQQIGDRRNIDKNILSILGGIVQLRVWFPQAEIDSAFRKMFPPPVHGRDDVSVYRGSCQSRLFHRLVAVEGREQHGHMRTRTAATGTGQA